MTAKAGTRGAANVSACAAAISAWAASCAGPDFSTGLSNEAGTSDGGGDAGEELAIIDCPGCWDMADATIESGAEAGEAMSEAQAPGATQDGGDGSNGPELSLLAGALGGPGNADGVGVEARFRHPGAIAYDTAGNVYISSLDHTIRRLSLATGIVNTIAGSPGVSGSADGVGSLARFYDPGGLAVDNSGNLYVADSRNDTIRRIVLASGAVTTIAGLPLMPGATDGVGSAARFSQPGALVGDGAGNLYAVDGETIRKIVIDSGADGAFIGGKSSQGRGWSEGRSRTS